MRRHYRRASARAFDARVQLSYPPYEAMLFNYDVPVLAEAMSMRESGFASARCSRAWRSSNRSSPASCTKCDPCPGNWDGRTGEGLALVEGFRGDVLAWVRLDAGARVERCHLRDPSWFQWLCSRLRSKTISLPTSRSATNPSTALTLGMIFRA